MVCITFLTCTPPQMVLMQTARAETPNDVAVAKALLEPFEHPRVSGQRADQATISVTDLGAGKVSRAIIFGEAEVRKAVQQTESANTRQLLIDPFTLHLDGAMRLALSTPKPTANPAEFPENHLMALLKDPSARSLSEIDLALCRINNLATCQCL